MSPSQLTSKVSYPGDSDVSGPDTDRTVLWLRGEHDLATVDGLSEDLADAIARDRGDLVLDLSRVQFMGVATVGVIVRARELLAVRSRALTVRSPSACARRLIELCELTELFGSGIIDIPPAPGGTTALGTWVDVPTTARALSSDETATVAVAAAAAGQVSARGGP